MLSFDIMCLQCPKKFLSNSPGLVDFPVGLVDSVRHLPDGQVKFLGTIFEEFKLQIKYCKRLTFMGLVRMIFWASTSKLELAFS